MIWLTWRQYRKQALYTLIALAALAALMLPTGLAMHHAFTNSGLAACLDKLGAAQLISSGGDGCRTLGQQFSDQFNGLTFVGILFVVLPVFVGLFFGAPLVSREVEHGTHRLVWTQGVSRRRWALAKFGLIGAVTLLLATAYALGMSWWFGPIVANGGGRLGPVAFDVQGIAPIGYTLFAVALGIYAGTVSRKVLPAMGITLGGYAAVRILIETLVRPHYMAPESLSVPIQSAQQFNPAAGDWVYAQGVINGAGHLVAPNSQIQCPPADVRCGSEFSGQGFGAGPYSNWVQYQPGSRFWAFQSIETGVFLALTALLLYLTIRRIRRIA
jgi:ABC-type transport system involved in multi-copper enzyme maturation permease subunit